MADYKFKVTETQKAVYDVVVEADSLNEAKEIASAGRGHRLLKSVKRIKSNIRLKK